MFLNRKKELADFEKIWLSKKACLIIVYGRRRVGKTSLLKFWGKDKPLFYWTATNTTSKRLLQSFSIAIQKFKNPNLEIPSDFSYPNWESALVDLSSYDKNFLAVFDEFPYAIESEPEIPSLLQKIWDNNFINSKIKLAVTGSRIGMIEKHILSSKGPLYGRASAIFWLEPLPISEIHNFLPKYSPVQIMEVYSITGGVPLYIELFDDSISVINNLKRELVSTTSVLKGEPYFLIHEELKEPTRFVAILEAIGAGKRRLADIAEVTGIEKTHLVPYLKTLEGLRYIKRILPITENPIKSRKGLYDFSDLFLKFYFRFIAPNQNLIEEKREEKLLKIIETNLDSFVGKSGFETLVINWLITKAKSGELPFDPDVIGKYWDSKVEIDAAAISKKHRSMIIGEAKWTNEKCGLNILQELNAKAAYLEKLLGFHINKFIFSKKGFSEPLIERSKIENVVLVGFKELMSN